MFLKCTFSAGVSAVVDHMQGIPIFLTARLAALDLAVLSSTYWGSEDDLDIEYSLIFQPNANLMLAHCLRHWLNINPTLPHVTSRVW